MIAKTILSQIGGNHFVVMVGAKNMIEIEKGYGLQLDFMRNKSKATRLRVILDADDTYTVQFIKKGQKFSVNMYVKYTREQIEEKMADKVVKEYKGIYCDQLRGLFERETGLRTSLTHIYADC